MKRPLTALEFKKIYSKVPRLCVDLIVKMPTGIVLTLRSLKTWNNQWHLPGGTVFYKETIEHAITRIAKDELGISVEIIKQLGYIEYPSEEKERGFGWSVAIAILCKTNELKFTVNKDADKARILNKLPKNTISEQTLFLNAHWDEITK